MAGLASYPRVIEVRLTAISNVTRNLTNEAYGSYSGSRLPIQRLAVLAHF